MKKTLLIVSSLMLLGSSTALAQYNREYTFADVDTDGDGKISLDEAKAHPGFVNEAIYHMFSKARGENVQEDNWEMPLEQQEWDGLTAH